jgi:hypothetical protein
VASGILLVICFHACFLLNRSLRWRRYVPPKCRLTVNGLHDVISQKIVLFITTAVRTTNPVNQTKLTTWSAVHFKKLVIASASQEFQSSLWNPKVHCHAHKTWHCFLSWDRLSQPTTSHPIPLRCTSILILSSRGLSALRPKYWCTIYLLKSTVFWDITPCSPLKVNRRFGRTYRLHLQCRSRARNQREIMFTFSRLHGFISHRCENLKSYNLSSVSCVVHAPPISSFIWLF